jgi:hypothetical protein
MRLRTLAAAVLVLALAPSISRAEDERKAEPFETSWFGASLELWYEPHLSLHGKVGGLQDPTGFVTIQNTEFDAHDDLGVLTNTPKTTYLDFGYGTFVPRVFVDTRWISLETFWVTPFEYTGQSTITRSFSFAGAQFKVSQPVETDLAQSIAGFEIKVNILNNRFVRVSPIIAVDAIAIDWTVKDPNFGSTIKASTEDIDFPLSLGRYKVFPYPAVGGEVRAGYRDFVEADLKLTGMYVNYFGVQAWTALLDVGVTGYIPYFPYVGVRVGYRYYWFQAKTNNQSGDKQFEADLRLSGLVASVIVRF